MCWDQEGTSDRAWGGTVWGVVAVNTWGLISWVPSGSGVLDVDGVMILWVLLGW